MFYVNRFAISLSLLLLNCEYMEPLQLDWVQIFPFLPALRHCTNNFMSLNLSVLICKPQRVMRLIGEVMNVKQSTISATW